MCECGVCGVCGECVYGVCVVCACVVSLDLGWTSLVPRRLVYRILLTSSQRGVIGLRHQITGSCAQSSLCQGRHTGCVSLCCVPLLLRRWASCPAAPVQRHTQPYPAVPSIVATRSSILTNRRRRVSWRLSMHVAFRTSTAWWRQTCCTL